MHKYTIKRPKEISWIFMVFVLFLLGTYFYYFKEQPITITQVEKEDIRSFDEIVRDANAAYRREYIKEGEEAAIKTIPGSINQWEALVDKYKNNQPQEYSRTKDWDMKIDKMYDLIKKAEKHVNQDNLDMAQNSLSQLDDILEDIKEENDKLYLSDDFKEFFDVLKKVSEVEKKSEAKDYMNDLKFKFTQLKEHAVDEKYTNLIADLEKNIAKIDKLLNGPDFQAAQAELKPIFEELFINYF